MSHYAVAVFANSPSDFESLLAPYSEYAYKTRHVYEESELKRKYENFLIDNPSWREYGIDYWLSSCGYEREGGEIVKYYNDNAKWDYYSLDGRDYLYDLKKSALRRCREEDDWEFRKNDYKYPKRGSIPYAFITPDGVWHAPGVIGWFATDDSTEESQKKYEAEWWAYIASDENPYVNFVDCHI